MANPRHSGALLETITQEFIGPEKLLVGQSQARTTGCQVCCENSRSAQEKAAKFLG
jgi:hypothetical protein